MKHLSSLFLLLCLTASLSFGQRTIHVESNLPEARVFADSTLIGLAAQSPFEVSESVERITVVQPEMDMWSGAPIVFFLGPEKTMTLKAVFPLQYKIDKEPVSLGDLQTKRKNRAWISYAAAGTSVAAGILAVHFRTKADNRFDDYLESGSSSLKRQVKRLDVQSGVALGVMQVGVGVVAFRMIF